MGLPSFIRLFMLLLLAGCQRATYSPLTTTQAVHSTSQGRLVFLSFKATAGQPTRFALLNSSVATGTLKGEGPTASGSNYLQVAQLDRQQRVVNTASIDHPLYHDAEHTTPTGELARQVIRLPEAEFFIRLPLLPQTVAIRLTEYTDHQAATPVEFTLPDTP